MSSSGLACLGTGRAETARAVVEGIAYAVRSVLAQMEERIGATVAPLTVTGGAAFPLVVQTLANVLQRPLTVIEGGDSAAQGAALLAFVAAGKADDSWLAEWCPSVQQTFAPQEVYRERYGRLFAAFCSLYPALKPTFTKLAE